MNIMTTVLVPFRINTVTLEDLFYPIKTVMPKHLRKFVGSLMALIDRKI